MTGFLSRRPGRTAFAIGLAVFLAASACRSGTGPASATAGYITVRCADEALPMMMEEAYAFMDLYPRAKVLMLGGGSDRALAAIFTDSAQVAVTLRPLAGPERTRARSAGFAVNEFRVARDGIAVIVNPGNRVTGLTLDQLRGLISGRVANWRAVGGPDRAVIPVLLDEGSGSDEFLRDSLLGITAFAARTARAARTEELLDRVGREPGAIALLSMSRLNSSWSPLIPETRVRAVALASRPGSTFVAPDEPAVHGQRYPLVRYLYCYTPREATALDGGFITFLTAAPGQKLIAGNGFVPITVPVKYTTENQ